MKKKPPKVAPDEPKEYILRLFITGATPNSVRAVNNIRAICESHLPGRYSLEVIDVYQQMEIARLEQLVALPLLIKTMPLPERKLIGDLSQTEKVLSALGSIRDMESKDKTLERLSRELEEARRQLYEATETIEAIRTGQVDALVVQSGGGHQLYSLKTADHTYRVFIEKMSEGAVTLNREGIIVYANSQFAAMVQLSLSGVIGIRFSEFIDVANKASFERLFQISWIEDSKAELRLSCNAVSMPVQLSLTPLELDEGVSLSVIITDLTTQKATQKQLEESNRELENLNKILEASNHDLQQFASVASHDLQEPLRKIQMFINILKQKGRERLNEEDVQYLDKVIGSAGRMKALIIDVLNYSRLSANDGEFDVTDLELVFEELQEDYEIVIQEKKAVIKCGALPTIEANRGQMRQVFQNLLSNALKFSDPRKPPVIRISSKYLAKKDFNSKGQSNGPYCLINMKDNGIGFDEKYIPNIFSLFERLHPKDLYEGTGIGLAIAKKIVEKHHGLISVRSADGKGAEFMIILPVKQSK